ncbi:MAG: hypothetical protein VKO21_01015 [Candidatus Sericytochromatia bacterium]|nr:hypothetical protein [Candidatus Sericytochromatia bacterium]
MVVLSSTPEVPAAPPASWSIEARLVASGSILPQLEGILRVENTSGPCRPAFPNPAPWATRQAMEIRYGDDVACRAEPCSSVATWSVLPGESGRAWSFRMTLPQRAGPVGRAGRDTLLVGAMPWPSSGDDRPSHDMQDWETGARVRDSYELKLHLPHGLEPVSGMQPAAGPLDGEWREWRWSHASGSGVPGLIRPPGTLLIERIGPVTLRVAAPAGSESDARSLRDRARPILEWMIRRFGPPPHPTLTLTWTDVLVTAREVAAPGLVVLPELMMAQERLTTGWASLSGLGGLLPRALARQWFPSPDGDVHATWLGEVLPQWVAGTWMREERPGGTVARSWLEPVWRWLDPLRLLTPGLAEEDADGIAYQEVMGEAVPLVASAVADRMARPRLWASRGPRVIEDFRLAIPRGAFQSWLADVMVLLQEGRATTDRVLERAALHGGDGPAGALREQVLGRGGFGAMVPPRLSAPAMGWHADVGGVFRPQPWFFGLGAYPWAATWASRNQTFIGDLRLNFVGGHPPGEGWVPYVRPGVRALVEGGQTRGVVRVDSGLAWVPEPVLGVRPRGLLLRVGAEGLPGAAREGLADAEAVWHQDLGWRRRLSLRAWTGVAPEDGRSLLDLGHEGLTQWDPVGAIRWGTTVGAEAVTPLGSSWRLPWLPFEGWTLGTAFLNQAWYGLPRELGGATGTLSEAGIGVVVGLPSLGFPSLLGAFVPLWTLPHGGAFVPVVRAGSAFRF